MNDDELEEAYFEGTWYRWNCPHCENVNEVEEEDPRGQVVECDVCGEKSRVSK